MNALQWHDKKVVIVGFGLTGQACARYLLDKVAQLVVLDSRTTLKTELPVTLICGDFTTEYLFEADVVIISPGVDPRHPAIQATMQKGIEVIGDVELFARLNTLPVIAITGSNGKSTVTALVTDILRQAGRNVLMGGNIGTPVMDLLGQEADILVLELSSFQLETLHSLKPLAATVLNVTDDHLDRHGDIDSYQAIKQRIYHNATHRIVNRLDQRTWTSGADESLSFGLDTSATGFGWSADLATITFNGKPYLSMHDCHLVGSHNALNIQAAAACAKAAQVTDEAIKQGCSRFTGLPHRFETVATRDGIRWINDSKATNVGATLAAVSGLADSLAGNLILLAGGDGKGADFTPLKELLESRVLLTITFGRDGDQIAALTSKSQSVSDLPAAVKLAGSVAKPGDCVLLSPACASLDMFTNYQQRGECFRQAVREYAA